ncbi:CSC1-like protein [Plasmodium brasilianum]|uniref:CSC1-like protein n=1 Tax=Plasmodium brasilianum TaxID=5824 RepID=A0ACB9Y3K1_PLABR|nr:CSC1-like protein [Plasmodium brasilianum]
MRGKKHKKLKNETEDFLIAFLFDIVFFAICVCIWLYLRKHRDESKISDHIYVLNNQAQGEGKVDKDGNAVKEDEPVEKKRKANRFRTFLNIKDDKIVNTEIKYYLFFLKANRNIIFSLCLFGTFLVLPLYLSLPRDDINNPSFFNYISAGSISDINVLTILFIITIIYSAISYTFIYFLWRKIRPSKKKTKKFLPQNFTIMVSRIDKNEINAYKIYKYFCNLTNNKVVSAYLILDYSIVYHEQKKIFNATKNLKLLKENEEKKNIKRDKSKKFFLGLLNINVNKKKKPQLPLLQVCDKNMNETCIMSECKDKNAQDGGNNSLANIEEAGRSTINNSTLQRIESNEKEGKSVDNYSDTKKDNKKLHWDDIKVGGTKIGVLEKDNNSNNNNRDGRNNDNFNGDGNNNSSNNNSSNNHSSNNHSSNNHSSNNNNSKDCNDNNNNNNDCNNNNNKDAVVNSNNNDNIDSNDKKSSKKGESVDAHKDHENMKWKEDGEIGHKEKKSSSTKMLNKSKNSCKQRCKRSKTKDNTKKANDVDYYDEDDNHDHRRHNLKDKNKEISDDQQVSFLKDTSDEDEDAKDNDEALKNNIEENIMRSSNNDMLFYDLDNLSTKDNDNMDMNYKGNKNRCKSESKRNIFEKLFFFLKKNKKSHWKKKLKEHLIKFYSIKNETPKKSTGVCFVSFIDTKSVHDCIHNIPFTERNKWIISSAPPNYDIIWKNLKNSSYKICARFFILNAMLLLANTIIIITVTSIDNILKLKIKKYRSENPNSGNLSAVLTSMLRLFFLGFSTPWLSPFIVIVVNSIIQPALISCVSVAIGFIRKSSEHTYVLQGNFIFLILNTIIIPLLSLSPLSSLIKVMYSDEIGQWSTRLGAYLFNSSGFFAMRYLLHCCFLTCANQLLQIPQFSIRSIVKTLTKKETSAWSFDFGYWYGLNTTILALILTFSVAVPFILPLGSLYFFLRYYIDKYNLVYEVCRTNLDSHGAILVMFTFFSRVQNKFILVGRNILFLSSSLTTLLLLCRSTEWVSTNHIKKKKGKRTFCYLCEKNVYVNSLRDLNKLKYAYANPYETKR